MSEAKKPDNSKALIEFCGRYTALLADQVVSIRGDLQAAVEEVMASVTEISEATQAKKREAESMLEQTYLAPDEATQAALGSLQDSVDALLADAQAAIASGSDVETARDAKPAAAGVKADQITSRLATGMQKLDQLDNDVKGTLMKMMGALSADDLIAQKMEHVVNSLHGLQVSLSYVLLDITRRIAADGVVRIENELQNFTFSQYTTEEEKAQFLKYFPDFKKSA